MDVFILLHAQLEPMSKFVLKRFSLIFNAFCNLPHLFQTRVTIITPNLQKKINMICVTQPKLAPKTTKFTRCGPDGRGSSPIDDNFFSILFFFTFLYVRHYVFLLVLNFQEIGKIDVKS